jgi:predicted MFS family arabinose efflux permease
MKKKESILTRDFILLFLISVAVCTAMNMLNVLVPLFVTRDLGSTTAVCGFLSTTYLISSCLSRPVAGVLVDRMGRRKMMVVGSLLFALALLLCNWITAVGIMFVLRAMMGIGYAAASTANNTASTDVIPPQRISEGIGYFGISQNFANAAGPALAAFLVAILGNRGSLVSASLLCFAAALISLAVTYEKHSPPVVASGKKPGFAFEKTAAVAAVFQGFSLFFVASIMCFMTLYVVSLGLSSKVAGMFFVISSVAIIAVRMGFSRFVDKLPRWVLLTPAYGILLLAALLLPYTASPAGFYGISLLYGLGHGTVWTVLGSEAVRRAKPERRGAANATFYFAFDAGIGTGSAVWGISIDALGFVPSFRLAAVGFAILAIAAVLAFRKKKA